MALFSVENPYVCDVGMPPLEILPDGMSDEVALTLCQAFDVALLQVSTKPKVTYVVAGSFHRPPLHRPEATQRVKLGQALMCSLGPAPLESAYAESVKSSCSTRRRFYWLLGWSMPPRLTVLQERLKDMGWMPMITFEWVEDLELWRLREFMHDLNLPDPIREMQGRG